MKKTFILLAMVMCVFLLTSNSFATSCGDEWWQTPCPEPAGDTINNNYDNRTYDNSVTNQGGEGGTGVGIGIGVGIGKGGNATIEKGAIKNTNENKNTNTNLNLNSNKNENKNTNLNLNSNKNKNTNLNLQGQKQDQKQKQGQLQGQIQSTENSNNAKQSTKVTVEGDTYEASKMHIQGPGLMDSDAKLQKNRPYRAKTVGSIWDKVDFLTDSQAKKLATSAPDTEVTPAIIFENEFKTTTLNKGVAGEFMGYLYVSPDGNEVNAAGMEGKAAEKAMALGATHMIRVYRDNGIDASGSSWNIGIGGGASIVTSGDSLAIAPNGGMGIGGAKASNEARPDMVFEIYFVKEIIKEKVSKKSNSNTGAYEITNSR